MGSLGVFGARIGSVILVSVLLVVQQPMAWRAAQCVANGDRAAALGEGTAALAQYARAAGRAGFSHGLEDRLIGVYLAQGDSDSARIFLYQAAERRGWDAASRAQLQAILEQDGDREGAAALAEWGMSHAGDDPSALAQLADRQIARLAWDAAAETLSRLALLAPDDASVQYRLGLLLIPDARSTAQGLLLQAALNPEMAERVHAVLGTLRAYDTLPLTAAHTALGATLVQLGEWAFAERMLMLALETNAVNPEARAYLGYVRDRQGRDGLADLQAALAMQPNNPLVHYLLGQHWRLVGDHAAAYEAFARAYALDPGNPALAMEIALSLQYVSDLAGAERWYEQAVMLDPQEVRWRRAQAAFYADTGYQLAERGMAAIADAAARAQDDADIAASLGWAYLQLGDSERAYKELSRAMTLDPSLTRSRYYFARVLEQRGDVQAAIDSYWYVEEQEGPDGGFGLLAARALDRLTARAP